mmetsp:Transcript_58561/g.127175  ORF Transcript_58561/g.127175 Transcript_58561/m.127175 type:complete len:279 (-) Transcript_58561:822-1658(-)
MDDQQHARVHFAHHDHHLQHHVEEHREYQSHRTYVIELLQLKILPLLHKLVRDLLDPRPKHQRNEKIVHYQILNFGPLGEGVQGTNFTLLVNNAFVGLVLDDVTLHYEILHVVLLLVMLDGLLVDLLTAYTLTLNTIVDVFLMWNIFVFFYAIVVNSAIVVFASRSKAVFTIGCIRSFRNFTSRKISLTAFTILFLVTESCMHVDFSQDYIVFVVLLLYFLFNQKSVVVMYYVVILELQNIETVAIEFGDPVEGGAALVDLVGLVEPHITVAYKEPEE